MSDEKKKHSKAGNQKIQTLEKMKRVLSNVTERCSGCGPTSECPILASIDSGEVLQ